MRIFAPRFFITKTKTIFTGFSAHPFPIWLLYCITTATLCSRIFLCGFLRKAYSICKKMHSVYLICEKLCAVKTILLPACFPCSIPVFIVCIKAFLTLLHLILPHPLFFRPPSAPPSVPPLFRSRQGNVYQKENCRHNPAIVLFKILFVETKKKCILQPFKEMLLARTEILTVFHGDSVNY